MAKRRRIQGKPLLVASVGVAVALGCGGGGKTFDSVVVGNLIAPPPMDGEVCVDPTPADASVTIDGEAVTDRCTVVQGYGPVLVEVTAPGFIAQEREVLIDGVTEVEVTLAEEPKPVKKPKPPPREPVAPPVGNL
ncbi:MAG: hypothetical protein KC912_26525, partial [Proteobacteria bacterium]|nr:hypothetical protein [Pseudomonadota bacterium]